MAIRQVLQITESHCGPAVLEMLLEAAGVSADQTLVTQAAGAAETIGQRGVTVEQLAAAVQKLAPHLKFLYKYQATLKEVRDLLAQGYEIGVQWQGLFYESVEEEKIEEGKYFDDRGHYSVITELDEARSEVVIINPHNTFAGREQRLAIPVFLRRWWDYNEVENPVTGKIERVIDERGLFMVIPYEDFIHPRWGLQTFERLTA